jgi:uncharacterized protein (TIGR02271 family)
MVQPLGSGDALPEDDRLIDSRVIDSVGHEALIVAIQGGENGPQAWIRMAGGTQVLVPVRLLVQQSDGIYRLPLAFNIPAAGQPTQMSFPVMEEELHVAERVIDTGRGVRINKTVTEREQVVDPPLLHDELEVTHVPVGRVVAEADVPQTRHEGDTLIVPVMEEVLVVQKQLLLKEEIRITRHRKPVRMPQNVLLRSEQVTVKRFDESREKPADGSADSRA